LERLIALVDAKYVSSDGAFRPFDLSTKAQYFALDVISDVSFSQAFGFLAEDRDLYQYIEINNAAVPVMNMMQTMPWLAGIMYRWPFRLALPSDGDKVGFGRLMGYVPLVLHLDVRFSRHMANYLFSVLRRNASSGDSNSMRSRDKTCCSPSSTRA